mgnify:CR=1 FL=1
MAGFTMVNFRRRLAGPVILKSEGEEGSFTALVRRYAPGIPPVAMVKELKAAAAIEEVSSGKLRAVKRAYIPRDLNENQIRLWGSVLRTSELRGNTTSRVPANSDRGLNGAQSIWCIDRKAIPAFQVVSGRGRRWHFSSEWMIGCRLTKSKDRRRRAARRAALPYWRNRRPSRATTMAAPLVPNRSFTMIARRVPRSIELTQSTSSDCRALPCACWRSPDGERAPVAIRRDGVDSEQDSHGGGQVRACSRSAISARLLHGANRSLR